MVEVKQFKKAESPNEKKRIGDLLVEKFVISAQQLEDALKKQKEIKEKNDGKSKLLGEILIEMGYVQRNRLVKFVNDYKDVLGISFEDMLVLKGRITDKDLLSAREIQKKTQQNIIDILSKEYGIDLETLTQSRAEFYNVTRIKPQISMISHTVGFLMSFSRMREESYLIYNYDDGKSLEKKIQKVLVLVTENSINNSKNIEDFVTGTILSAFDDKNEIKVEFGYCTEKELQEFINLIEEQKTSIKLGGELNELNLGEDNLIKVNSKDNFKNETIGNFFKILFEAVRRNASDIHVEPMSNGVKIRFRVDGMMQYFTDMPNSFHETFMRSVKTNFKFAKATKHNERHDERQKIEILDLKLSLDLRISVMPSNQGETMVIRILQQGLQVPDFTDLGMLPNILKKYLLICSLTEGIIIVTGPTGSGKSTTLHATLCGLNDGTRKIITVEDPVEFTLDGVIQIPAGGKENYEIEYIDAIKGILRQDPDILMFGEIRDQESAEAALTAGQTGHLLFTTLHANNAAGALPRLYDMHLKPVMLGNSLVSVLGQRLVRRICSNCKETYEPDLNTLDEFRLRFNDFDKSLKKMSIKFYRGKGCKQCNHTGYKGRIGLYELLCINDQIKELVLAGKNAEEIEDMARYYGMVSLSEDGFIKVINGYTTMDEVLRVTKRLKSPKIKFTIEEAIHQLEGDMTMDEIRRAVIGDSDGDNNGLGIKDSNVTNQNTITNSQLKDLLDNFQKDSDLPNKERIKKYLDSLKTINPDLGELVKSIFLDYKKMFIDK